MIQDKIPNSVMHHLGRLFTPLGGEENLPSRNRM